MPTRRTRAESFLGIHFDFHAGQDCTEIGKSTTREGLEQILAKVQPDYVQCDCKGHPGVASYPTKVGTPAPGFTQDQLKLWREVTAAHGVALFMHYSGVWDNAALTRHPEWGRVDEKGVLDKEKTSVFGPYADELLIRQLLELAREYQVDGAWVDGECWATQRDYSTRALAAFQQATGLSVVPRTPEDPGWREFSEFCREGFRQYLRHYVDAVHAQAPHFQIASNWAFSSLMPEPVSANVDFLSGDYSMQDSVNAARLEGRCLMHQGLPWDLMAWAFASKWAEGAFSTKSVPQLQREAALVLALGGGFQAYFTQQRDAGVRLWQMDLMAEVGRFCRARQALCHRAQSVPQIALLYSGAAHYRKVRQVFAPWGGELVPLTGMLNALLESQLHVDIVSEHHLAGPRLSAFPLVIVPETEYLAPDFRQHLLDYVAAGGSLLLVGPRTAALFAAELDVTLLDAPVNRAQWLPANGWLGGIMGLSQTARLGTTAQGVAVMHDDNDPTSPTRVAASITPYGRGKIAATYLELGLRLRQSATATARRFMEQLVRQLYTPLVTVTGSTYVDVTIMRQDGRLHINLINTSGPHADPNIYVIDEIRPIGPLLVTVRLPAPPTQVTFAPVGTPVAWSYADGTLSVVVPELAIHEVLVIA